MQAISSVTAALTRLIREASLQTHKSELADLLFTVRTTLLNTLSALLQRLAAIRYYRFWR
jgi:hypothetical protein